MMRTCKKFGMIAVAVLVPLAVSSCGTLRRYPRHHHHHPHRHRVVIIAEKSASTWQDSDCVTFEECLAMSGPDSYGSTE